jgi:hypothetical protein
VSQTRRRLLSWGSGTLPTQALTYSPSLRSRSSQLFGGAPVRAVFGRLVELQQSVHRRGTRSDHEARIPVALERVRRGARHEVASSEGLDYRWGVGAVPRSRAIQALGVVALSTRYGRAMWTTSRRRLKTGLSPAVVVWRAAHALVATGFLASIADVWWCALSGRRGPFLRPAVAALVGEGVLVAANRGDCPLGAVGDRLGDPVPLFELALSPRAARRAVPTLGVVTAVRLGLLAARSRGGGAGREMAARVPVVRP